MPPNSAAVYGDMPKDERDYVIQNFKSGNISVVFNMEVLTTGFDFPSLDTIILSRPTNSLAKYYQMIGRITRLYDVVGTVIDLVGTVKKFGKVEELNFENVEGYGWGMFSGDRLLTGIRLDDDRHVTKQMIFKPTVEKINGKKQQVFKFGKYQYVPLKDVPKDYLKWSLLNIDFKKDEKLKKEILKMLQS
jgi:superfamily II DNA/RNA helicase